MAERDPAPVAAPDPRVAALFETARKKLVDTGIRNRLVHVNRKGRGRWLNVVNERSDDIFRILYAERRKMRFHPSETAAEDVDEGSIYFDDADLSLFPGVTEVDESRFTDRLLDTNLGTDALQKRLLQLAGDARRAEEEQGINILFLALGFLQWFEAEQSSVRREAPLILVPVELVRNQRTSTYDVCARDEDIMTNLSLQARLRDDFGVVLPEIETDDDWTPSSYFQRVRDATMARARWRIDENGMQIGFFSFAKQLMQRDLHEDQWPEGSLGGEALIRRLTAGFEQEPPLFAPGERLDAKLAPADVVQVIDADAPQTAVIEEFRRGRSLVVQGPPGTGKSQTITNLIAAAAHDGKTVLFMAEKMAALNVVFARLKKCGLGDLCLELHSRHVNKREVAQELGRTLRSRRDDPQPDTFSAALRESRDQLNRIADLLHTKIPNHGYTPFEAMAVLVRFIGSGRQPPQLHRDGLEELTGAQCQDLERDIGQLATLLEAGGLRSEHPLAGCRNLDLQPVDLQRLDAALQAALEALDKAMAAGAAFARGLPPEESGTSAGEAWLPRPASCANLLRSAEFLELVATPPGETASLGEWALGPARSGALAASLGVGVIWAEARREAESLFVEHAWDAQAAPLSLELQHGAASGLRAFLARMGTGYRRACRILAGLTTAPLPKQPAERLKLARQLQRVQRLRSALADEEEFLASRLGDRWRGERTDFAPLARTARWVARVADNGVAGSASQIERAVQEIHAPAQAAENLRAKAEAARRAASLVIELLSPDPGAGTLGESLDQVSLSALRDRFSRITLDRYTEWRRIQLLADKLKTAGLNALVEMLDDGRVLPADSVQEFAYAAAEARWDLAKRSVPELATLVDLDRHALVRAFTTLDVGRTQFVQELIRRRHLAQLPQGAAGEMGVIRGEIARKRRHLPIRRLMERAGSMVQRIKPVFLMSPISIAQFLPPKALRFDVLVVDEASQVRPEDALGAISRCGQLVIVGDQKQLPPTSFFDRLGANEVSGDEDEDEEGIAAATEMESVLTLCEARGMNQRMLEWHYRSRDPSLIRVSNEEFYERRLILPPSPLEFDEDYGLSLERVPGAYVRRGSAHRGRPGTNRIEAERVVKAAAQHVREDPGLSLGIVTFSKAQANMMTEILEYERRRDQVLDDLLREGHAEDVFVKNIENVQGDERDVIFISVGYGPEEPGGRLTSMRFGPVNTEGGERRLNVLFTRARARCRVFASFDPGDIDLSRTAGVGPRILKRFLEYAATGQIGDHQPTGAGADSPFEEDVARAVRSLGYLADPQVGSTGFRVDIGVRHPDSPGRYLLAIECDGAAYHSALSARERDRHRQAVLEGLGWRFHRIWSTDWFHRRPSEMKRLKDALAKAGTARDRMTVPGANDGGRRTDAPEAIRVLPANSESADDSTGLPPKVTAPPYRSAAIEFTRNLEPHEIPEPHLADLARRVVDAEGPVHLDIVARRITEACGRRRTGARILEAVQRGLRCAQRESAGELLVQGEFWWTRAQSEDVPVRDRTGLAGGAAKAAMLPPMEIVAAAERIERESGRVERAELVREVARVLGFKRTGADLTRVIAAALSSG